MPRFQTQQREQATKLRQALLEQGQVRIAQSALTKLPTLKLAIRDVLQSVPGATITSDDSGGVLLERR